MRLSEGSDGLKIHTHVLMDQHVTQAGNTTPQYLRMSIAELHRQQLCSLADDLDLTDRCIVSVGLGHESVMAHACVPLDLLRGIKDVS